MRNKGNILLLIMSLAVLMSSCLKDDDYALDPKNGVNVIEFYNVTAPSSGYNDKYLVYVPMTLEVLPSVTFQLGVNYAGPTEFAPQDIVVQIASDNATVTQSGRDPLPADLISIPSSVTIKKGETFALFDVTVKPNKFDLEKLNAFGLKITSTSFGTISGNNAVAIYSLPVKSPYDAFYTYTTSAKTSLVPNANKTLRLATVEGNGNKAKLLPGLLGTYSNEVIYTVNPKTFHVTVECPSLGVQTPQDARSNWDPATRTMTVFWKQGNGGRTFEEVFVFKEESK